MSNENKSFSFSYSGAINDELEQIKEKYTKKEVNERMKHLRSLDKRVDFLTTMISISFGIFATAVLILGVIGIIKTTSLPIGIAFCAFGILADSATPFLHFKLHNLIKAYYAPKIIALIKEIEQNQI